MSLIIHTEPSFAFVFLRLSLAVTFFAHGSQHLFGWFGGKGIRGQLTFWEEQFSIPATFGSIGIFIECVGSLAMISGFLTRLFALGIAVFIGVALFKAHWRHGYFVHGSGEKGTGVEYSMTLLLVALALVMGGGGAMSVDLWLSR